MRLAVMQPYFFPYIGYFQLMAAADRFLLYDNLNFIRRGWVHRNRIRLKGREAIYCSVPLVGASSHVKIRDLQVNAEQDWQRKLLDLLAFNYKRAPFFSEVYALVERVVRQPATHLSGLNQNGIRAVSEYLGIMTPIHCDTAPFQRFENEAAMGRSAWLEHLQQELQVEDIKTLRVLHICRHEKADTYINPPGGQALYSKEPFARNGVTLQFIQPRLTPYPQQGESFLPALSILDMLMHCGGDGTRQQLSDFTLL